MFNWVDASKWALVILIIVLAASVIVLSYFILIRLKDNGPLIPHDRVYDYVSLSIKVDDILRFQTTGPEVLRAQNTI